MEIIHILGDSLPFFHAYIPSNRLTQVESGRCCAVGALTGDRLAAGAAVLEESGAEVVMTSLMVDQKVRRAGYGRALTAAAARVAAAYGATRLEAVYALPDDECRAAAAFLMKNGFSVPQQTGLISDFSVADLLGCSDLWRQDRRDADSRILPLSGLESRQLAALEDSRIPEILRPSRFAGSLRAELSLVWLQAGEPAAYCIVTGGPETYEVAAVYAFPDKEALAVRVIQALARQGAAYPGDTRILLNAVNKRSARLVKNLLGEGQIRQTAQYFCTRSL